MGLGAWPSRCLPMAGRGTGWAWVGMSLPAQTIPGTCDSRKMLLVDNRLYWGTCWFIPGFPSVSSCSLTSPFLFCLPSVAVWKSHVSRRDICQIKTALASVQKSTADIKRGYSLRQIINIFQECSDRCQAKVVIFVQRKKFFVQFSLEVRNPGNAGFYAQAIRTTSKQREEGLTCTNYSVMNCVIICPVWQVSALSEMINHRDIFCIIGYRHHLV